MIQNFNKEKLLLISSLLVLFFVLLLLIFNSNRGLDVSDEGYYVLVAKYMQNWYLTSFHEGYYTNILYTFFNDNLAYIRSFGVLFLTFSAFLFAITIKKFINEKFELELDKTIGYIFIITIATSSFFYYIHWLLTPSYNLFSLIFVNLILANYFWILNNYDEIKGKFFRLEYIFLGLLFSILFVIKITVAFALFLSLLLFSLFEYKKIDFKRAFVLTTIVGLISLLFHIILIFGSFNEYFEITIESIGILKSIDSGYSLLNIFGIFKSYAYTAYKNLPITLTVPLVIIYIISRQLFSAKNILNTYQFVLVLIFAFMIYAYVFMINSSIWFMFSVLLLNLFLIYFYINPIKETKKYLISTIPIIGLLILSSISSSYGTNNSLIPHMSMFAQYISAALLILILIIDKISDSKKYMNLIAIFISLVVLVSIYNAYNNPYRLNTSIGKQTQEVNILGGLKVDEEFKKYTNKLLVIKEKNPEIEFLFDMTGASSGAIVILGSKYIGSPWVLGGYRGSNIFALNILKKENPENLKKAWILKPNLGTRAIDLSILDKVGINFPEDYELVETFYLKLRDETQELWRPKYNE